MQNVAGTLASPEVKMPRTERLEFTFEHEERQLKVIAAWNGRRTWQVHLLDEGGERASECSFTVRRSNLDPADTDLVTLLMTFIMDSVKQGDLPLTPRTTK
jgi:hypothetical protein